MSTSILTVDLGKFNSVVVRYDTGAQAWRMASRSHLHSRSCVCREAELGHVPILRTDDAIWCQTCPRWENRPNLIAPQLAADPASLIEWVRAASA